MRNTVQRGLFSYSICEDNNGKLDFSTLRVDDALWEMLSFSSISNSSALNGRLKHARNVEEVSQELKVLVGESGRDHAQVYEISELCVIEELDSFGWDGVVDIETFDGNQNLVMSAYDTVGRLHRYEIYLPKKYPLSQPILSVDLPIAVQYNWGNNCNILTIKQRVEETIQKCLPIIDVRTH